MRGLSRAVVVAALWARGALGLRAPGAEAVSRRACLNGVVLGAACGLPVASLALTESEKYELYQAKMEEKSKKRAAKKVEYGAPKLDPLSSELPDLSKLEGKATTAKAAAKAPAKKLDEAPKIVEAPRAKAGTPDVKSVLKAEVVDPTKPKIVGGDAPIDASLTATQRKAARKQEILSGEYAKKIKAVKGE